MELAEASEGLLSLQQPTQPGPQQQPQPPPMGMKGLVADAAPTTPRPMGTFSYVHDELGRIVGKKRTCSRTPTQPTFFTPWIEGSA